MGSCAGHSHWQDEGLHQVRLWQPCDGHWRPQLGACGHHHQPREAPWELRHCAHQGHPGPHLCHTSVVRVRDRQGIQAVDLAPQGQGCCAVHRRGARQEAGRKVKLEGSSKYELKIKKRNKQLGTKKKKKKKNGEQKKKKKKKKKK